MQMPSHGENLIHILFGAFHGPLVSREGAGEVRTRVRLHES